MKLTKKAEELKKVRDNDLELPAELEDLAMCMGSESFDYALFEGGYLHPEDWVEGEDLKKLQDAIKIVEEFKHIVNELHEEF